MNASPHSMNSREARISVNRAISNRRNVLIEGKPGCGKTSIANDAAKDLGMDMVVSNPATSDPTDSKGLGAPSADNTHAEFLPFGEIFQLINATRPTLWCIEDFGQTNSAMQAAFMPWLLARRNGMHILSDYVTIVSTTNSRAHKAGVSGLIEPVKSRFHKIIHLESNYKIWREDFAIPYGIPAEIISYLDWSVTVNNTDFNKFEATTDLLNTPSERTYANAGDNINDYLKLNPDGSELEIGNSILFKDVAGSIGYKEATNLWTFLQNRKELVEPISYIIENPNSAFIPKGIQAQFLVMNSLTSSANEINFENILSYASRFYNERSKELAVSLVNDILLAKKHLLNTPSFIKMATQKGFGEIFVGKL